MKMIIRIQFWLLSLSCVMAVTGEVGRVVISKREPAAEKDQVFSAARKGCLVIKGWTDSDRNPLADITSYVPQLTNSPIQGRVTATTFVLDKPQCLFGNSSNNVWLVVASSTATVDNKALETLTPYSSFSTTQYYHTFKNPETFYMCSSTPDYIRVGSDSFCSFTDTFCNKPLPKGTYKVKFVVINTTNALIDQTNWSRFITLREGKDPAGIDTWPGRRSGGMIVITTILSVLLATVLACLVGTFIIGRKNLPCFRQKKMESNEMPIPQVIDLKKYKTHHVPPLSNLNNQQLP